MTKDELNNLVNNLGNASTKDLDNTKDLLKRYPYFQALHVIQAKIAAGINQLNKNEVIGSAAIHTADRGNLKNIIEGKVIIPVIKSTPKAEEPTLKLAETTVKTEKPQPQKPEKVKTSDPAEEILSKIEKPDTSSTDDSNALFQEVLQNLEKLKSLRKQYEFLEEQEQLNFQNKPAKTKSGSKSSAKTKTRSSQKTDGKSRSAKKSADTSSVKKETAIKNDEKDIPVVQDESKISNPDLEQDLSLKKIDLNEQNFIIENFIKNEAEFSKKKPVETIENKTDLAADSVVIKEDLVSENLAEIMIEQGKTDKAIEIYKKLIWKFPQKKSYFASRIEEITKK